MLVKGLVAKLVPVYAQNTWKSMVQIAELTTCCNYLKKKKKQNQSCLVFFCFFEEQRFGLSLIMGMYINCLNLNI